MKELDGGFMITLFKDNITPGQLAKLGLNDRQVKAVLFVKEKGRITNREYQELNTTSERTASRDLNGLIEKNIFRNSEVKGAGSFYFLV
jgi:ATP-dependent DNA helicase RecG